VVERDIWKTTWNGSGGDVCLCVWKHSRCASCANRSRDDIETSEVCRVLSDARYPSWMWIDAAIVPPLFGCSWPGGDASWVWLWTSLNRPVSVDTQPHVARRHRGFPIYSNPKILILFTKEEHLTYANCDIRLNLFNVYRNRRQRFQTDDSLMSCRPKSKKRNFNLHLFSLRLHPTAGASGVAESIDSASGNFTSCKDKRGRGLGGGGLVKSAAGRHYEYQSSSMEKKYMSKRRNKKIRQPSDIFRCYLLARRTPPPPSPITVILLRQTGELNPRGVGTSENLAPVFKETLSTHFFFHVLF